MLRKHNQFFASLVWLFDMAVVAGAFALAFAVRFMAFHADLPMPGETGRLVVMAVAIFSLVFRWSGLYRSHRIAGRLAETFAVFKATSLSLLLLVAATYYLRDDRYSRLTLLLFGAFAAAGLATTRSLARRLLSLVRRHGHNLRYALVVGAGDLGRAVVERLEHRPEYGIKVTGLLSRTPAKVGRTVADRPVVGVYEDLERVLSERTVDQIYFALPLDQHPRIHELLAACSTSTADVKVVPDLYQYMTLHGGVEEIDGMPVVALRNGPVHGWDAVAKRAFDLLFGCVALVAASPAMLASALLVKLTSPGPVVYAQERMGLDGRTFRILKFRSMRGDAESGGARWAKARDDRTTPVGAFLRRFSLDELPQLFNVLRGDMSLVGPRPERPVFIEDFKRRIPNYTLRHKVKAGITGLAQVEGWRGQTSLEKRIERDLYYIENWSIWLDMKILVRTALGGFLSRNAY